MAMACIVENEYMTKTKSPTSWGALQESVNRDQKTLPSAENEKHLGNLFGCADHLGLALQMSHNSINSQGNPSAQVHGVHSSSYGLATLRKDGSRQHCCSSRSCKTQWIKSANPRDHWAVSVE